MTIPNKAIKVAFKREEQRLRDYIGGTPYPNRAWDVAADYVAFNTLLYHKPVDNAPPDYVGMPGVIGLKVRMPWASYGTAVSYNYLMPERVFLEVLQGEVEGSIRHAMRLIYKVVRGRIKHGLPPV